MYEELIQRLREESEIERWLQPHSANETPKLLDDAAHAIEELSKERKTGKWRRYSPLTDTFECDQCGYQVIDKEFRTNFCPNCGAKMEG